MAGTLSPSGSITIANESAFLSHPLILHFSLIERLPQRVASLLNGYRVVLIVVVTLVLVYEAYEPCVPQFCSLPPTKPTCICQTYLYLLKVVVVLVRLRKWAAPGITGYSSVSPLLLCPIQVGRQLLACQVKHSPLLS